MSFGSIILSWYNRNKRDLPWRGSRNPYFIWLSEIIMQQTRIDQGTSYYLRFVERFPTVETLARAKQDEVLKLWQGLGYYTRARNLHAAAREITGKYKGKFPNNFEELRTLKGVGDYTAAAIASFAYDQKHAVVDGNVYRLLSRYFGISTAIDSSAGKKEFQQLAQSLMEKHPPHLFNQAIMEFGALQCRPANPDCANCPLHTSCFAFEYGNISSYPVKKKQQKVRPRYLHYLVIHSGSNFYIRKRETNDIWKNLYEFPLIETEKKINEAKLFSSGEWKNIFGKSKIHIEKISGETRHLLSHQSLHAKFYELRLADKPAFKPAKEWKAVTSKTIHKFAVPRLIEKYLESVETKRSLK